MEVRNSLKSGSHRRTTVLNGGCASLERVDWTDRGKAGTYFLFVCDPCTALTKFADERVALTAYLDHLNQQHGDEEE